eukprot:TRINITY_DN32273_c0_g1_i1.p2 TRINITY_DN32273_c0_g1~~TRINITY_DN32273_c0_g1_i1.p2  ORF type:complete len:223 (+),score=55.38 TRINITY_DN32273_c0_g1_i1:54-671(+)
MAASRQLCLVWASEGDGQEGLRGYKGVVDAAIDVAQMPDPLRRHVVRITEVSGVSWIAPRPALLRPLDLVWEEEDGSLCGFDGVVSSRVDPAHLPEFLHQFIRPHSQVRSQPHRFIPLSDLPVNPIYVPTSKSIGQVGQGMPPPDRSRKHDEPAPDGWHGRQGNFTSEFGAGQYRYCGLNCKQDRDAVGKPPSFNSTPAFVPRIT